MVEISPSDPGPWRARLNIHADHIKARAVRRCGELAKLIEPDKGTAGRKGTARSAPSLQSRKAAANGAGLSSHQLKQAIRVANVPREDFERQVESEKPPTVTGLAEQGKKPAKGKPGP